MKTALILHGTGSNSSENWFPWLQSRLQDIGYVVWTPNLPEADYPNIHRYNEYIFANLDFTIDENTIIIGHSSGSVAILGLLQALPAGITVKSSYLIGSFKDNLGRTDLEGLFREPFDFEKIKTKSRFFYFIHSDNDPYCPTSHAEYLHSQIGGDLIILPGQKHFSIGTYGPEYKQFSYLFHLIASDAISGDDVANLYRNLENMGVNIWLDGGWAVDAVLGEQTRPHSDIDIVVQEKDVSTLTSHLTGSGFREILRGDTSSHNFLLGNDQAKLIDVHVIKLDNLGNGIYGPAEKGAMYPADALSGQGTISGMPVRCISPQWLVKFHTGYPPRQVDHLDVLALCNKFGVEVPKEYQA